MRWPETDYETREIRAILISLNIFMLSVIVLALAPWTFL